MNNNNGVIDKAWALLQKKRPEYELPSSPPSNRCFNILFSVPENTLGVPRKVAIEIQWGLHFPYDEVEAFSKDELLTGFPHQMAENGKLCLERSIQDISDDSLLFRTVEGVENWLNAMATNTLFKEGDVYELPDFGYLDRYRNEVVKDKLFYLEDERRYAQLLPHLNNIGRCKLVYSKMPNVLVPREFSVGSWTGEKINDIPFTLCSPDCKSVDAAWVLLSSIIVERYRPPKSWAELYALTDKYCIFEFRKLVRELWENAKETAYLLIGWPIPDKVGGDNKTIAWCACAFQGEGSVRKTRKIDFRAFGKHRSKAGDLWQLSEPGGNLDAQLHWMSCENISYRNYTSRWKLDDSIVNKNILLVGCGAIGSEVAEVLVRGGQKALCLIDKERVEFGNLCRHVASAALVGLYKTEALKWWLSLVNPMSRINSCPVAFIGDEEFIPKNDEYDLLLDCTANDKIMRTLAKGSRNAGIPYVKFFINPTAEYLTMIISGTCIRGDEVLSKLLEVITLNDNINASEYYGYGEGLSVMAPGCWHPTYPGRWVNIKILIGMAIEILEGRLKSGIGSDGFGAVIGHSINDAGLPETRVVYAGEFAR